MPPLLDLLSDPRRLASLGRGLTATVGGFLRRAKTAVASALRSAFSRGIVPARAPSLAVYVAPLAEAAAPLLVPAYRRGVEALEVPGPGFAQLRPEVLVAVDRASLALAQSTMNTAQGDVTTALDRLRAALKEGLTLGEALPEVSARVEEIFKDPRRARRIAATETVRAVHAGWFIRARASGVRLKRWMASTNACPRCKALARLGAIPLEQPFFVDPRGGEYATCQAPPLHPFCLCSIGVVE